VSGEKDELAEVVGESGLVQLEAFLTSVFASVIDGDSDSSSKFDTQTNRLDFSKSETLAESGSMTIADSLASDGGSKSIERSGSSGGSSGSAGSESSALAAGLVEPDLDVALPVLSEMDVGEDVVVLDHVVIK
jgi:hypothetical protein